MKYFKKIKVNKNILKNKSMSQGNFEKHVKLGQV